MAAILNCTRCDWETNLNRSTEDWEMKGFGPGLTGVMWKVRLKGNIQVRFCLLDYYRKCTENLWAGLSQVQPWILIEKLVTVWVKTKAIQKVFTVKVQASESKILLC